jgi:hypothetical protein
MRPSGYTPSASKFLAQSREALDLLPFFSARSGNRIKYPVRIPLLTNCYKPFVIRSPEGVLPVGLKWIALQLLASFTIKCQSILWVELTSLT